MNISSQYFLRNQLSIELEFVRIWSYFKLEKSLKHALDIHSFTKCTVFGLSPLHKIYSKSLLTWLCVVFTTSVSLCVLDCKTFTPVSNVLNLQYAIKYMAVWSSLWSQMRPYKMFGPHMDPNCLQRFSTATIFKLLSQAGRENVVHVYKF